MLKGARVAADKVQEALRWLSFQRAHSYRAVFGEPSHLSREQQAVIADLRDFCFADRTSFSSDPLVMAQREGMRRVFLRIRAHLDLSDDDVTGARALEVDSGL
jgi:hypothetical protein